MIKVAFVNVSQVGGHAIRGIGFYSGRLLEQLQAQASQFDMQIIPVTQLSQLDAEFDLVHYPYFDLFSHTLPIFQRHKFVVTVHDVIPLEFPIRYPAGLRGKLNYILQRLALSQASMFLTDSFASVKALQHYMHLPPGKIRLTYLASLPLFSQPVPSSRLASVRKQYQLPPKFVLFVGDLNWNKNLPTLLTAAASINLPVVLVGKTIGNLEQLNLHHPELRHLREHLNLFKSPQVQRLGFVSDSDLQAIYKLATVYCQPSFAEGFGIPLLDALTSRTPVISSRTPSLSEVAGDAALYFDPDNPQDLAAQLSHLLSNSSLRRQLVSQGIIQARKFSWQKTATETLQVYREALTL